MSINQHSPLKETAKKAPKQSGVYFWRNDNGEVLYVGRATNLRNRLSQYFLKNVESRIAEMVASATDLTWITCESVLESIFVEAKYIKKYWPKYNIKDRDGRSFLYIVISKDKYPKPVVIRGQDLKKFPEEKNKIFGPYQSASLIFNSLKLIRKIFPWSTCKPLSGKPCFDYQIGLCPGACVDAISPKEYKRNINNLIMLLSGNRSKLIKKLSKENPDQAQGLQHLQEVSLLRREADLGEEKLSRIEGYDISHFGGKESYGSMVVFENGEPNRNEYRLFKIKEAPAGDDERALAEVLLRRLKHKEWTYPDLIMIDGGSPQISFISRVLSEHNISLPIIGISKFSGDKLVYSKDVKSNFKDLGENIKGTLLKVREEAHRFANYGRKKGTNIKNRY